ncbi:hypothetical protein [Streptomyces sp. st115]|uniref:hypothetical protein n=1 Tax=Streptomyces sp. st115 TaxID=1828047 RepID=UPI000BF22CCE|nr:hypothetical protein [Streptomyces sp. st115]
MLFVAASAAFLSLATTTSASAAYGTVLDAQTTGAYGTASITYGSRTNLSKIEFRSVDLLADGHHARLRLITKRHDGSVANWAWRYNYGGKGAQPTWTTTLSDPRGVAQVRLQVCRGEGDDLLNCAYSRWELNAYK